MSRKPEPSALSGFCSRCCHMLPHRDATAHDSEADCIATLRAAFATALRMAEREHRWVHRLEDRIAELKEALRQIEEVAADGHLPPRGMYGLPFDWRPFNDNHDPVQAWCADRAKLARESGPAKDSA